MIRPRRRLGLFLPRPTPFYRALLAQMREGFASAGFEVHAEPALLDEAQMNRFCHSFRPDVVFEMNRTRREMSTLPPGVIHVAWVVDYAGRRDDQIEGSEITYVFDPGWKRAFRYDTFVDWLPPGTCARTYQPRDRARDCEVLFLGHIPRPWTEAELGRDVSRTAIALRFRELIEFHSDETEIARIVSCDSEGSWDHTRYWRAANRFVQERTGAPMADDPKISYDLLGRLLRAVQREAMLDEAVAFTSKLDIWGSDSWRLWEKFRPYYRGFLDTPASMSSAYGSAQITLHEGVGMHFRALDCLASGGLLFYATERKAAEEYGGWGSTWQRWGDGDLGSVPLPGRHYVEYYPGELAEIGRYYLANESEGNRIRAAAREEIVRHHTWSQRAAKVARDLDNLVG